VCVPAVDALVLGPAHDNTQLMNAVSNVSSDRLLHRLLAVALGTAGSFRMHASSAYRAVHFLAGDGAVVMAEVLTGLSLLLVCLAMRN